MPSMASNTDTLRNGQSAQLQPISVTIPPLKQRKSRKAPAIKTSVIVQRAQGKAKSHIARDLGITHNTVNRILEESDIERQLSSGELAAFQLMHKSLNVLDKRLDKESESAATYLLSNTLFSERYSKKGQVAPSDVVVNLAIQNLINPAPQVEKAIDVTRQDSESSKD